MEQKSKTVLILGASGGIGAACAKQFSDAGYRCALQYHQNERAARSLCETLSDASCIQADLRDPAQARRAVSLAEYHLGSVQNIVYCAGTAKPAPFSLLSDEDYLCMYELHVMGAVRVVRAALESLIACGGSVVLFSSMWGQVGAANESAYAAAKGAVIALAKSLAKELGVYGIRVNCVSPGLIDTPMNGMFSQDDLAPVIERTPLSRAGTPEEAAACAVFLCGESASFVTGQVLCPNGGIVV